jgi:GT2 family glycosyltransferase
MKEPPEVSIIIVNWNGKNYLENCFSSIFYQTYQNFEVILVDNGSRDGSVEYIIKNFPATKIIENDKNIGLPAATNMAIKSSQSKYLVTLDNDTRVEPQWLEELVKAADSDSCIGSCQSKVLSIEHPEIIDAMGISITKNGEAIRLGYGLKDKEEFNEIKEILGASTAILYRREMFDQIGLFDEDFFAYYEDVDLALRSKLMGWRSIYVPKAIAYHVHSATLGKESPFKLYLLTRNAYYFKIKNLPREIVLNFMIRQIIAIPFNILGFIKNGDSKSINPYLKGNWDGFRNSRRMFIERREIRSRKIVTDSEIRRWLK